MNVLGIMSEPGFLKPQAVDHRNPRIFLWMDLDAIQEQTRIQTEQKLPIIIETNMMEEEGVPKRLGNDIIFPLKPLPQNVGEFKVTPAIHAGYSITWFGLFGAGVVMTRKLITKGR